MTETHQPCTDCGSSDGLQVNEDASTFCHVCRQYTRDAGAPTTKKQETKTVTPFSKLTVEPKSIPDRGFSVLDTRAYGVITVGSEVNFPYYNESGELVAYKVRRPDKTMHSTGTIKEAVLFGQQLFNRGCAKMITIVEGEYDALASYQMQGSKYPVVSIKNGASAALKDCKDNYEYLNSFDKIYINFDSDEPGQKAAKEVLELFSGKAYNVKLKRGKDANDYLLSNDRVAYMNEWWDGEAFVPSGLINGSELRDDVMKPLAMPIFSWPWDGLNLMTYGIRSGEIITLTAGTGSGKTTLLKQVVDKAMSDTKFPIGMLSLEEGTDTAALSLMSMYANKRFHLPTKSQMLTILNDPANIKYKTGLADEVTDEEKSEAFEQVLAGGRLWFYQHNGDSTVDSVCDTIKYMSKVVGCPVVILDHVSILVGMQHSRRQTSEREAIDDTMHTLRSLVEETGVTILLVSHLSKGGSNDTSHEEGGRVKMSQMRGSNAIAQLSNLAIAIERDTQAEDVLDSNLSTLRVLKNRLSGETGVATVLQWDEKTGKLNELLERVYTGDPL